MGGPRLPGKPDDPELVTAHHEAFATKATVPARTLQAVLNTYLGGQKFADLAPRNQHDYVRNIKVIETEFGTFPIATLSDRRTRGEFPALGRSACGRPGTAAGGLHLPLLRRDSRMGRGLGPRQTESLRTTW